MKNHVEPKMDPADIQGWFDELVGEMIEGFRTLEESYHR